MAEVPKTTSPLLPQEVANAEHDTDGFKRVRDVDRPDFFLTPGLEVWEAILIQQKITNAHLAHVNGFILTEEDI